MEIINAADGIAYLRSLDFGKIMDAGWQKSIIIGNKLLCDAYIMMPNHIHTILIIEHPHDDREYFLRPPSAQIDCCASPLKSNVMLNSSKKIPSPIKTRSTENTPMPHHLPNSILSFLKSNKSAVNTKIDDYIDEHQLDIPKYNRNNHFFQPNYHDHITQNDIDYERIKKLHHKKSRQLEGRFF